MEYQKTNAIVMKKSCYFEETFADGSAQFRATCRKFAAGLRRQTWRKLWRYRIGILLWFSLAPYLAFAQPEHFALLVTGASGNDESHDKFSKWSTQLLEILQKDLLYPRDHIYFLTETPDPNSLAPKFSATKTQLARTFDELRARLKKGDLLFIVLLGHASFDGMDYKFNLVGPDLTGAELRFWLDRFSLQTLAIVAATPCSGILSRQLSLNNRMLITATKSEFENNNIIFPEFLIEALKDKNADRDKNLHVSFLEAFLFSSQKTASWYKERGLLATEHPTLEDNGSQTPATELSLSNPDGLQAAYCFLDHPIAEPKPTSTTAIANAELDALDRQRRRTEELIRELKNKKATLAEAEYLKQLETLLIQLAKITQKVRDLEKKK